MGGVRGAHRRDVSRQLTQIEQLLVETADAAGRIGQMDFQNPMADAAVGILASHRLVRTGRDVPLDAIADDLLVRKLPDQMAGDRAAELEAFGVSASS